MKKALNKLLAFFMAITLIVTAGGWTASPIMVKAETMRPPGEIVSCDSNFGVDFKLIFSDEYQDWLNAVTSVTVEDIVYEKGSSSYSVWQNKCYYVGGNVDPKYILIGEGFEGEAADCVISADGYTDLIIELNKNSHSVTIREGQGGNPVEHTHTGGRSTCQQRAVCEDCGVEYGELGDHNFVEGNCTECGFEKPATPSVTADSTESTYFILRVEGNGYVDGISSIACNDVVLEQTEYMMALNGTKYYLDKENNAIYFDKMSGVPFKSGDILTIQHPEYDVLSLKIVVAGNDVSVKPAGQDEEPGDEYTLHVRLVGYFESALVNQKGYDAISGASTGVTENKNSNASVEVALLPKDMTPGEGDWKPLNQSDVKILKEGSAVNIDTASGMKGVYSIYDSSVTLSGTPAEAGEYPISVTITDDQGRTATSNALIFKVYSGQEYLADQLILDNCTQTADGKYMYDMEPWAIKNFVQAGSEEVTVPADIKAWYGSHTSGTYGELGYAIPEGTETTQTLIVPSGCNLTLVNMDILSSVRIVVQDGGTLVLRDSTVQGIVDVQNGGTFSMNYDDYTDGGTFLTGASINGQLVLRDGATLKNAKIYSNTNNIANGTEARKNTNPVVVTEGNVNIEGQVFIRGDEAPTGTDSATGKSYAGQTGLMVKNGTLTLTEGAVLAVYGGGHLAATSVGGTAVILDQGTIAGPGKLIAVGGQGTFDNGGNAVEGNGSISTFSAYLEGGNSYQPKEDSAAGEAVTVGVTLSDETKRKLVNGKEILHESDNVDSGTYWNNTGDIPNLDVYEVGNNTPEESPTPTPTETPDPTGTPAPSPTETPDPRPTETPTPVPEEKTWKVIYNTNTQAKVSGIPSDKTSYDNKKTVTVKGTPTRANAFFDGWNTKADGSGKSYTAGKTFKITENTTLYAQWKSVHTTSAKLQYKVTGTKAVACIGTINKTATTIKIPKTITYKGITYRVTSVAKKAFSGNKKITSVSIGNNVKTIGNFAFYGCSSLKKVTIGTGLTSIGRHVFCQAKKGCTITINSKNLKSVVTAMNHGIKNMVVKVPKSKVNAYKKLFASRSITVKTN